MTAALGQFACYARIFSLWCLDPPVDSLLNTAQCKVSLEPISVEPVCLSALYSVAYTLSSPFINNLFDWWPLCMTTMSTSPPSIIITIAIIPFSWHLNQMSLAYLEIWIKWTSWLEDVSWVERCFMFSWFDFGGSSISRARRYVSQFCTNPEVYIYVFK